jgi:hypothetical protein
MNALFYPWLMSLQFIHKSQEIALLVFHIWHNSLFYLDLVQHLYHFKGSEGFFSDPTWTVSNCLLVGKPIFAICMSVLSSEYVHADFVDVLKFYS